jgi:hypothetical protein
MMIVGTSVLALLVLASGALAAPSLGMAKGRPYYGSSNQGLGFSSARSFAPAPSTETRQSFSYEPAEGAAKEDVDHGLPRDVHEPQPAELTQNSGVAPASLFGDL